MHRVLCLPPLRLLLRRKAKIQTWAVRRPVLQVRLVKARPRTRSVRLLLLSGTVHLARLGSPRNRHPLFRLSDNRASVSPQLSEQRRGLLLRLRSVKRIKPTPRPSPRNRRLGSALLAVPIIPLVMPGLVLLVQLPQACFLVGNPMRSVKAVLGAAIRVLRQQQLRHPT